MDSAFLFDFLHQYRVQVAHSVQRRDAGEQTGFLPLKRARKRSGVRKCPRLESEQVIRCPGSKLSTLAEVLCSTPADQQHETASQLQDSSTRERRVYNCVLITDLIKKHKDERPGLTQCNYDIM